MAWDFSTDPGFQKTLDWIREFVDREVLPIETLSPELTQEQLERITAPLKAEVIELLAELLLAEIARDPAAYRTGHEGGRTVTLRTGKGSAQIAEASDAGTGP